MNLCCFLPCQCLRFSLIVGSITFIKAVFSINSDCHSSTYIFWYYRTSYTLLHSRILRISSFRYSYIQHIRVSKRRCPTHETAFCRIKAIIYLQHPSHPTSSNLLYESAVISWRSPTHSFIVVSRIISLILCVTPTTKLLNRTDHQILINNTGESNAIRIHYKNQ